MYAATTEVRSLNDLQRWSEHHMAIVSEQWGVTRTNAAAASMGDATMSTAYSGTGGAEVATSFYTQCINAKTDSDLSTRNLFCVEYNVESQYELMMLTEVDCCIFGDMTNFLVPSIRQPLQKQAKRMRPEDLERIVVTKRNSSCSLKSWCVRHKRYCSAAAATVHAAGTPCGLVDATWRLAPR